MPETCRAHDACGVRFMSSDSLGSGFYLVEVKGDDAAKVLEALSDEGYAGTMASVVSNQLAAYAWPVLHAKLLDGTIATLGRGLGAREVTADHIARWSLQATRDELVSQTVSDAVPAFMTNVQRGGYDPTRGTTLATFFTGFAFTRFRTYVHPKWANGLLKREYELGQVDAKDENPAAFVVPDFSPEVIERIALHRAIVDLVKHAATLNERAVVLGLLRGMTESEIAAQLCITTGAVEKRLAALRRKSWRYHPDAPLHYRYRTLRAA